MNGSIQDCVVQKVHNSGEVVEGTEKPTKKWKAETVSKALMWEICKTILSTQLKAGRSVAQRNECGRVECFVPAC